MPRDKGSKKAGGPLGGTRGKRGRPKGSGYDDASALLKMAELIHSGEMRSIRAAAKKVADSVEGASKSAIVDRLRQKYTKQRAVLMQKVQAATELERPEPRHGGGAVAKTKPAAKEGAEPTSLEASPSGFRPGPLFKFMREVMEEVDRVESQVEEVKPLVENLQDIVRHGQQVRDALGFGDQEAEATLKYYRELGEYFATLMYTSGVGADRPDRMRHTPPIIPPHLW